MAAVAAATHVLLHVEDGHIHAEYLVKFVNAKGFQKEDSLGGLLKRRSEFLLDEYRWMLKLCIQRKGKSHKAR